MNRGTRRGTKGGRGRRIPPPKKDNTAVLVASCAGGVLLLVIIIAAAASGSGEEPRRDVPQDTPIVDRTPEKRAVNETGSIMFVCSNTPKHEDKEKIFRTCTGCNANGRFFFDQNNGSYKCAECGDLYPNSKIRCDECGRSPQRSTKIKH